MNLNYLEGNFKGMEQDVLSPEQDLPKDHILTYRKDAYGVPGTEEYNQDLSESMGSWDEETYELWLEAFSDKLEICGSLESLWSSLNSKRSALHTVSS